MKLERSTQLALASVVALLVAIALALTLETPNAAGYRTVDYVGMATGLYGPGVVKAGVGLVVALAILFVYCVPTLVALLRVHHQVGAIIVINLFLGWTFLGWVVALAMACGAVRRQEAR